MAPVRTPECADELDLAEYGGRENGLGLAQQAVRPQVEPDDGPDAGRLRESGLGDKAIALVEGQREGLLDERVLSGVATRRSRSRRARRPERRRRRGPPGCRPAMRDSRRIPSLRGSGRRAPSAERHRCPPVPRPRRRTRAREPARGVSMRPDRSRRCRCGPQENESAPSRSPSLERRTFSYMNPAKLATCHTPINAATEGAVARGLG